jgi:cell division protease FtsH
MDEIDAVGRHRGAGMGGGHDEREQTLNQLLVEMDGFEAKDNIIMIAATNRPDILDPALLRPGRFDRQITVDRPDRKGRAKILEVHTRGKPLAKDIEVDALAGQTPASRAPISPTSSTRRRCSPPHGQARDHPDELEEGIMRVVAGPEKKTRVMGEKERLITPTTRWATRSSATSSSTPTRSTRSRSSPAAGARATRSRCRRRTSSSPPRPS